MSGCSDYLLSFPKADIRRHEPRISLRAKRGFREAVLFGIGDLNAVLLLKRSSAKRLDIVGAWPYSVISATFHSKQIMRAAVRQIVTRLLTGGTFACIS
jgi:hypothetical protein